MKSLFLVSAAVAAGVATAQGNPGVTASVSDAGAQYLVHTLLPVLIQKFSSISIPDISTNKDGFDIDMTDITCNNFQIGGATVSMAGSVGAQLTGIAVSCSANWHFKLHSWPHIPSGSGSADASVSSTSCDVGVALTESGNKPQVSATGVSLNIGSLSISFHGSLWDWLLDLLKGLFGNAIKSAIDKAFATAVTDFINNDANKILAKIPIVLPLHVRAPYDIAEIRFGLTSAPVANTSYLGVALQGDVVPIANPVTPPIAPPSIPTFNPSSANNYVQLHLSSYTALSLVYVYYTANLLQWHVPSSSLPGGLNVSSAYFLIAPGLPTAYPNAAMSLNLTVPTMPTVTITPAALSAQAPINIGFVATTASGSVTAFTLAADVNFAVNVSVGPDATGALALVGSLQYLNASLSVASSSVGTVNAGLLQTLIDVVFKTVVVPIINGIWGSGIPLPQVDGLKLSNTQLVLGYGNMMIASDFTFTPNLTAVAATSFSSKLGGRSVLRGVRA